MYNKPAGHSVDHAAKIAKGILNQQCFLGTTPQTFSGCFRTRQREKSAMLHFKVLWIVQHCSIQRKQSSKCNRVWRRRNICGVQSICHISGGGGSLTILLYLCVQQTCSVALCSVLAQSTLDIGSQATLSISWSLGNAAQYDGWHLCTAEYRGWY